MKLRNILMMLSIFGALNSCGKGDIEYRNYFEHVYINETSHYINMHSYSFDERYNGYDWSVNPNDSIRINNLNDSDNQVPVPAECDSVLVTFDNEKSIMVAQGVGILSNACQERVSRTFVILRHYITDKMYDSAKFTAP